MKNPKSTARTLLTDTQACVIAYTILVTIFANSGYARHAFYLSFTDMQGVISLNLAIQSLIIIPLGAGKVSGAFIQKRLMPLDAKCQQWVLRAPPTGFVE